MGADGVNMLVDALTGGTGAVEVDLSSLLPPFNVSVAGLANVTVALGALRVAGLDTMEALQLLEPVDSDAAALRFAAALGALNLSVDATVGFSRASGYAPPPLPLHLGVGLADLELNATARLALNGSGLGAIEIGQALSPACYTRQIFEAALTQLGAGVGLASLTVGGPDWGRGEASAALALPSGPLPLLVPPALAATLCANLSAAIAAALANVSKGTCPPAAPPGGRPSQTDLTQSALVKKVHDWSEAQGPAGANALLDQLSAMTGAPNGTLTLPWAALRLVINDAKVGRVGIVVDGLTLHGLDSLYDFEIAAADDPVTLHHSLALGGPSAAAGSGAADALTLGATLQLTLDGTRHDFGFELSIRKLAALLRTQLVVDDSLLYVKLGDLLRHPACVAAPLHNLSLVDGTTVGVDHAHGGHFVLTITPAAAGAPSAAVGDILKSITPLAPGLVDLVNDGVASALGSAHEACAAGARRRRRRRRRSRRAPTGSLWASAGMRRRRRPRRLRLVRAPPP